MNKKGETLQFLTAAVISIVVVGVIAVVGFLIIANLKTSQEAGMTLTNASTIAATATSAYNATLTATTSMQTLINFLPIIAVVVAGAAVIGLLGLMRGKGEGGL